jgi:RNA polymerase sigma-70 factor (ECF subfamily)
MNKIRERGEPAKEAERQELSEAEMIAGCRAGNRAALEELVKRYQTAVLRVCVSLIGSRDVEDLVQDIFIKILRRIRAFEGRSSLFTWIYEIAANHCRDELRRRQRRRWFSLQSLPQETMAQITTVDETISDEMEAGELRRHLRHTLNELDPKYRELVVLRDLEGLSYEEIAKISGIAVKLVKSRLHQARQLLAEKMKKYVEEVSHG